MSRQPSASLSDWIRDQLSSPETLSQTVVRQGGSEVAISYIKYAADESKIQQQFIQVCFSLASQLSFEQYIKSLPNKLEPANQEEALHQALAGAAIIEFGSRSYVVDIKKTSKPPKAEMEKVIQGPQAGFDGSLETNLNLLRSRYPQASLTMESYKAGSLTQTNVTVLYDKKKVNEKALKAVQQAIQGVKAEVIMSLSELGNEFTKNKRTLFPTSLVTERPDRVVLNLAQGKVVLLMEGTPFALIVPAVYYDFISSMEDRYHTYWVSHFIILLRYTGLFITVLLPSSYVGITAYFPELFRVQLALSIAGSRAAVPYPAFMEVLFMLLMMEMLTEASVRLPKVIGQTATTVGGLILGQAATAAGLVSNIMIIIVAAVAIANFVIPINAMSFSIRVSKYIVLVLTVLFGMIGLLMGFIGLIAVLTSLDSFGQPFLKIFPNESVKKKT